MSGSSTNADFYWVLRCGPGFLGFSCLLVDFLQWAGFNWIILSSVKITSLTSLKDSRVRSNVWLACFMKEMARMGSPSRLPHLLSCSSYWWSRCCHFLFTLQLNEEVINPWRACAAMFTVLGLCVYVSVTQHLTFHMIIHATNDTNLYSGRWRLKILSDFLWKCFVAKLERFVLVWLHDKLAIFTLQKMRVRIWIWTT